MMRIAQEGHPRVQGARSARLDPRSPPHHRRRPVRGGDGLVMKCEPIFEAYDDIAGVGPRPTTVFPVAVRRPVLDAVACRAVARGAPAVRVQPLRRHRRARLRAGRSRDLAGRLHSDGKTRISMVINRRLLVAQSCPACWAPERAPWAKLRRRLVGNIPSTRVRRRFMAWACRQCCCQATTRRWPTGACGGLERTARLRPDLLEDVDRARPIAPILRIWACEFRRARCVPGARHPAPLLPACSPGQASLLLSWLTFVYHVGAPCLFPTGSMEKTIMTGDRVLAEGELLPGVAPGDIVMFKKPRYPPAACCSSAASPWAGGPWTSTTRTASCTWTASLRELHRGLPTCACQRHVSCLHVPGALMWMGDNRTNSQDSRYFGAVSVASAQALWHGSALALGRRGPAGMASRLSRVARFRQIGNFIGFVERAGRVRRRYRRS